MSILLHGFAPSQSDLSFHHRLNLLLIQRKANVTPPPPRQYRLYFNKDGAICCGPVIEDTSQPEHHFMESEWLYTPSRRAFAICYRPVRLKSNVAMLRSVLRLPVGIIRCVQDRVFRKLNLLDEDVDDRKLSLVTSDSSSVVNVDYPLSVGDDKSYGKLILEILLKDDPRPKILNCWLFPKASCSYLLLIPATMLEHILPAHISICKLPCFLSWYRTGIGTPLPECKMRTNRSLLRFVVELDGLICFETIVAQNWNLYLAVTDSILCRPNYCVIRPKAPFVASLPLPSPSPSSGPTSKKSSSTQQLFLLLMSKQHVSPLPHHVLLSSPKLKQACDKVLPKPYSFVGLEYLNKDDIIIWPMKPFGLCNNIWSYFSTSATKISHVLYPTSCVDNLHKIWLCCWLEDRDKHFAEDCVHQGKLKYQSSTSMTWFTNNFSCHHQSRFGIDISQSHLCFSELCNPFHCNFCDLDSGFGSSPFKSLLYEKEGSPLTSPKSVSPFRMFLGQRCIGIMAFGHDYQQRTLHYFALVLRFCLIALCSRCNFGLMMIPSLIVTSGSSLLFIRDRHIQMAHQSSFSFLRVPRCFLKSVVFWCKHFWFLQMFAEWFSLSFRTSLCLKHMYIL